MKLFNSLVEKYKLSKKKAADLKDFKISLMQAVSDGKLSEDELELLNKQKSASGLTDDDIKSLKTTVYLTAFNAAKVDRQITQEESDELTRIKEYLNISDAETKASEKELARFRLLAEINQGNLPNIPVSNIVTQKNEKVYWVEPSILAEEKVVRRRYEGGSHGVSLRIMKGVSYRVGASKGHFVADTDIVAVSTGEFIITNKRTIFRGDGKSFAFKLDKILDIQLFTNAIYLAEANKAKPRMVRFAQEGNHEIVGAILSYAINHYE